MASLTTGAEDVGVGLGDDFVGFVDVALGGDVVTEPTGEMISRSSTLVSGVMVTVGATATGLAGLDCAEAEAESPPTMLAANVKTTIKRNRVSAMRLPGLVIETRFQVFTQITWRIQQGSAAQ